MNSEPIGKINGKWAFMFKALLTINTLLLPFAVTWATWVTMTLIQIKYGTTDRLTGAMFIEIQDELSVKNPENRWLTAKEVRDIQGHNLPYTAK